MQILALNICGLKYIILLCCTNPQEWQIHSPKHISLGTDDSDRQPAAGKNQNWPHACPFSIPVGFQRFQHGGTQRQFVKTDLPLQLQLEWYSSDAEFGTRLLQNKQ